MSGTNAAQLIIVAPSTIASKTTNQENETVSGFRAALSNCERPDLTGWNCYSLKCLNYCRVAVGKPKLLEQSAKLFSLNYRKARATERCGGVRPFTMTHPTQSTHYTVGFFRSGTRR